MHKKKQQTKQSTDKPADRQILCVRRDSRACMMRLDVGEHVFWLIFLYISSFVSLLLSSSLLVFIHSYINSFIQSFIHSFIHSFILFSLIFVQVASILNDPSVIVLAEWLKIRGSLKSWTKLFCCLKPGLLILYKSQKMKSSK